ncbi:MAG: PAS domain-containing protein [Actinobacteria bacterium]|nr:PAS domain-containing protein [Actinomycetota bacterium]
MRLRAALARSQRPMLICDDQRRWVTGNAAAYELLGVEQEEISWQTMDDFAPPSERRRLQQQWNTFLASGAAEGQYELYVPNRGRVPVEFGAIAHVLPSRHLAVFMPLDEDFAAPTTNEAGWV